MQFDLRGEHSDYFSMSLHSKVRALGLPGFWTVTFCFMIFCTLSANGGAVFSGPSPYLTFTNSTFDFAGFDYFYLETCEDGLINTPGIVFNSGWLVNVPSIYADSVDADDGSINGSGVAGYSFLSGGVNTNLVLTFNAAALGGHLPTHVGMVCTDIGGVMFGQFGVGNVTFSAYDATNGYLGSITATNFGNGLFQGDSPGATAEDRFFGVSNPAGISSVSMFINNSKDWEVDHLQYGYFAPDLFVPELRIQPGALDTVILSWSTNAIGFALQETPSLPATNWIIVPTPPVIVGDENQVAVTPLSSNRFYRLINQ